MNQSKFSLADVLTVLAALAFGFVCFLGANFSYINDNKVWGMSHTTGCLVMAVTIAFLLFITAFGAKLLKRTSRNFKTSFVWEIVLLVLFVIFAVIFTTKISPFPHYFTVTSQKSEIINKLQASITQAENMFAEYESYAETRENLYKHKLQSVVTAKNPLEYDSCGFNRISGVSDASQIDTKMFTIHADLFPTNYSDTISQNGIKEVAAKWLQEAKNITISWKPIGIVGVVNDIEEKSNEWLDTLVKLSQIREPCEQQANVFEYNLLSYKDVKTHFSKLDSPTLLSIGFATMAYVLMLLSWYVTKRNSRSTGSFTTATYEVVL